MALFDVVNIEDDASKIRAVALLAAAHIYSTKPANPTYVIRAAKQFETYIRTGS